MKTKIFALVLMMALVVAGCASANSDSLAPRFITVADKTCEIHHVPMHKKSVTVFHGLRVFSEYDFELAKAEKKLFPHAEDDVLVTSDEAGEAEVFECPECRKARDRWITAHPESKREKRANQPSEPTATSVTICAAAQLAPAAVVAHL